MNIQDVQDISCCVGAQRRQSWDGDGDGDGGSSMSITKHYQRGNSTWWGFFWPCYFPLMVISCSASQKSTFELQKYADKASNVPN